MSFVKMSRGSNANSFCLFGIADVGFKLLEKVESGKRTCCLNTPSDMRAIEYSEGAR